MGTRFASGRFSAAASTRTTPDSVIRRRPRGAGTGPLFPGELKHVGLLPVADSNSDQVLLGGRRGPKSGGDVGIGAVEESETLVTLPSEEGVRWRSLPPYLPIQQEVKDRGAA